ncbi:MAG: FAD synthase [Nanoarchaeota archaeon]|nr:FAD synthase [Nanoarchaeota archaeon]MBU1855256.1 FAD synthase [Nanoarchaeota archaeon]
MVKVMAFGTFDVFHKGHEDYLRQAKSFGDLLVVVVAKNSNVLRLKGKAPLLSEKKRLKAVSECKYVDKAILGDENDTMKVVVDEKPDVICLGYDQRINEGLLSDDLIDRGLKNVFIVRTSAYMPEVYKSSRLKSS